MAIYSYKVRDIGGRLQSGKIEASAKTEVVARLKKQNLFCIEVKKEDAEKKSTVSGLSLTELSSFCRQMATMLSSGITLVRALDILYSASPSGKVHNAMLVLYEEVNKGNLLSSAMQKQNRTFPYFLVQMVQTGENSGTLDEIMVKMSSHYENEKRISNKVKTAMIYPCILTVVSIVSVIYMLIFVLPQFTAMYSTINLPLPTRILLWLSNAVSENWYVLLPLAFILIALLFILLATPSIRLKWDHAVLHIPIVGKLTRTVYTSRFSSAFGVLYASGMDMMTCLESSANVLGNAYIKKKLQTSQEKIRAGDMLSSALQETRLFDPIFHLMLVTGEEAGSLGHVLTKASAYFQEEADHALSKLIALVEPGMILLLAFIIGFIVLSIMLPIFSMYGQIA